MYFNQIAVPGLGCLSYAIGCPRAKAMAVIDPKRDVQDYLEIAVRRACRSPISSTPTCMPIM